MFRTHNRHNKKSRTAPAHTYEEAQKGKKKSSVLIQLSGWLRTLDMVEVTGFEPAASWSQTKRATICATPRCSVLKAGVSHKTYYTPEGEKMSSIGACKNALTNPARYGTVNAQTRNSTIRARLPGQPKNNDGCEIFRMNGKAAEPRVRGLCCSCRKIFCFPAGRRKHKGCPK